MRVPEDKPGFDFSDLKRKGSRSKRKPCGVGLAVKQVSDSRRKWILAALENEDEDVRRGAKLWLIEQKITPPNPVWVGVHMKRQCSCYER